jgi:DNA primase
MPLDLQIKSGLVVDRDGRTGDWFHNRLMIPICRDSGPVVAFGGRALMDGQQPKYLNSRETPIYTKGRTVYGLSVTKAAVRQHNYCVLVEGYFDLAQVWQAGVQPVAALSGTALNTAQERILKRLTSKVVQSLDPDTAGKSAAEKSSEVLVAEGFRVNVAELPSGQDPDVFIRRQGAKAYVERLRGSRAYLEFRLDRAAAGLDLTRPDQRSRFLSAMLAVAASIPDAAERYLFADRLAHMALITEGVIRDEIRKAAAQRKTTPPAMAVASTSRVLPAEQGLLWALAHRPVEGLAAMAQLEDGDLAGLLAAAIFRTAAGLGDVSPDLVPALLQERLTDAERALLDRAAAEGAPLAEPPDCVNALRRGRVERERTALQDEIDRLQEHAGQDDTQLVVLWNRKKELLRQLEALT